jgi:hypothetical protein
MGEIDFSVLGFVLVLLSAVLGGLRWAFTQRMLDFQDEDVPDTLLSAVLGGLRWAFTQRIASTTTALEGMERCERKGPEGWLSASSTTKKHSKMLLSVRQYIRTTQCLTLTLTLSLT